MKLKMSAAVTFAVLALGSSCDAGKRSRCCYSHSNYTFVGQPTAQPCGSIVVSPCGSPIVTTPCGGCATVRPNHCYRPVVVQGCGGCRVVQSSCGCGIVITPAGQPYGTPGIQPTNPGGSASTTYDSPDAAFKAAQSALAKKDFGGFVRCLTPRSQGIYAGSVAITASIARAFLEADLTDGTIGAADKAKLKGFAKRLDETLTKHGVTKKLLESLEDKGSENPSPDALLAKMQKVVDVIKDKPAFVSEVMAVFADGAESAGKSVPPSSLFKQSLKDIKISGDTAQAKLMVNQNGKDVEETLRFKKVSGSWLLDLTPEMAKKIIQG